MDQEYANLVAAALAFVGLHFAMSHPLRLGLVKGLGTRGFQAAYSLVALVTFVWMVIAFRAIPPQDDLPWNGQATAPWALATLLMLAASVLLVGSFVGNPALPQPGARELAAQRPRGVFHVTRHPMMWSFVLWGVSHVLVSPSPRVMILAGAVMFLALVGSHMQDRKKEVLMGEAWAKWEHRTSYWPRPGGFAKAGAVAWIGGVLLWLAASWAHIPAIGMAAGVWRWLL